MRALILLVLCGCPKSTEPVPDTAVSLPPASASAAATDTATATASVTASAPATATVALAISASATPTAFPLPPLVTCASDADCTLVHFDDGCCPQCAGRVGNRTWSERVNAFCKTQKVKCRPMACSYAEAIPTCKSGKCM
jgi:hypothetical protein